MSDEKCCTGCNIFFGGEIRHIKECFFYPESLTEIYDRKDEENAKLREENARLHGLLYEANNLLNNSVFTIDFVGSLNEWLKEYALERANE